MNMTTAYCPTCQEIRSDTGEDAWGFIWHTGAPVCQRCQSIVDLTNNGQAEENELEEIDQEEVSA